MPGRQFGQGYLFCSFSVSWETTKNHHQLKIRFFYFPQLKFRGFQYHQLKNKFSLAFNSLLARYVNFWGIANENKQSIVSFLKIATCSRLCILVSPVNFPLQREENAGEIQKISDDRESEVCRNFLSCEGLGRQGYVLLAQQSTYKFGTLWPISEVN